MFPFISKPYHDQSTDPTESPIISRLTNPEIKPDPYKYLIDLSIDSTAHAHGKEAKDKRPDHKKIFERLPESAKTYLRLLGRKDAVQNLIPKPSSEKIADAELAGGWRELRTAIFPSEGERGKGVYFDPANITAEAVKGCPTLPYMFNIDLDDILAQASLGDTLESLPLGESTDYQTVLDMSPYVSYARGVCLSNAIVPLSEGTIGPDHSLWSDLIRSTYSSAHPVRIVDSYDGIMEGNDERLILATQDGYMRPDYFLEPRFDRLDESTSKAIHEYRSNVLGYYDE